MFTMCLSPKKSIGYVLIKRHQNNLKTSKITSRLDRTPLPSKIPGSATEFLIKTFINKSNLNGPTGMHFYLRQRIVNLAPSTALQSLRKYLKEDFICFCCVWGRGWVVGAKNG